MILSTEQLDFEIAKEIVLDEEDYFGRIDAQVDFEILCSKLNDKERNLVQMRFFKGMTFQEIGDVHNVTRNSVCRWFQSIFDKLRKVKYSEPYRKPQKAHVLQYLSDLKDKQDLTFWQISCQQKEKFKENRKKARKKQVNKIVQVLGPNAAFRQKEKEKETYLKDQQRKRREVKEKSRVAYTTVEQQKKDRKKRIESILNARKSAAVAVQLAEPKQQSEKQKAAQEAFLKRMREPLFESRHRRLG